MDMSRTRSLTPSYFVVGLPNVHVRIDSVFLKKMMIKASKNDRPHVDAIFIEKLGMKSSGRYVNNTVYAWTKYSKTVPLEKLAKIVELSDSSWEEVGQRIIYMKAGQHGGHALPKFPIIIDEKLGSIIGHIMGDGSIDSKYKQVFYSNSRKELLHEFSNNMKDVFGVEPRIWMQKEPAFGATEWDRRLDNISDLKEGRNCGLFYPSICGMMLNKIFDDFANGKDKSLTETILNSNKEFKRGLIRAFYDDEASVGLKSSIRLFQNGRETLESFRVILGEFGIEASDVKSYIKTRKKRHYMDLHRKSNFVKFNKEIGFTSETKKERLRKIMIIRNRHTSK